MEENGAADAAPAMEGGASHEECPICAPRSGARRRRPAAAQRPAWWPAARAAAQRPSWWPAARAAAHARAAAALESPRLHLAVIALVFLDLIIIFTELALGVSSAASSVCQSKQKTSWKPINQLTTY
jgi:hypothetical protein